MNLHLHKDRIPLSQFQGVSQGIHGWAEMLGCCFIPVAGREHCYSFFLLALSPEHWQSSEMAEHFKQQLKMVPQKIVEPGILLAIWEWGERMFFSSISPSKVIEVSI